MAYYEPDLTGENEAYLNENDVYQIFKDSQRIEFPNPVFKDSISITKLGTINEPLVLGQDWQVNDSDIADTEIARMKVYDNSFDAVLVNAITVIKPYITDYSINIVHQDLYPIQIKKMLFNNTVLEVTPDLIGNMIQTIEYLTAITKPVTDVSAINGNTPYLLLEDPHMENTNNWIPDEEHEVNTLDQQSVIRPLGGSFFKENLVVRIKDNPDTLVENVDYLVFGVDIEKTKNTSIESGVYKFIMVLREFSGIVEIDYHGYGGDPTIYDVTELSEQINNIISFIEGATFLTEDTLPTTTIINQLVEKTQELEDDVRRLYTTNPSYGDVTSGGSSLMKIASTDTDLHWFSIATLYTVDGGSDIVTADAFRFRLSTLHTKFMFEAIVTVNMNNVNNPMVVNVLGENYPKGFIPFEDYSEINDIIRPQLRIIYNNNEFQNSGIVLQLGFELKNLTDETVVIEDLSGQESCWKLISLEGETVNPQDDVITLPNTDHVYDETNEDSVAISTLVPFRDGFITWVGSVPLNRPYGGFKDIDIDHILPSSIDLSKITKVRVELNEVGGYLFPVEIPIIPGSEDALGAGSFVYNGESAQLNVRFWRESGVPMFKIQSNIDPSTNAAQLDMKHLFIFT